jgi:hypothetical protein
VKSVTDSSPAPSPSALQIRALVLELKVARGPKPSVSIRSQAAAAFAFLLTRSDKTFQDYYLVDLRAAEVWGSTSFWPIRTIIRSAGGLFGPLDTIFGPDVLCAKRKDCIQQ